MTSNDPIAAAQEERRQRVRIGLTGLAFVFLLVMLGTAISRWSEDPDAKSLDNSAATEAEPNEPLAEIGAAPSAAMTEEESQNANKPAETP